MERSAEVRDYLGHELVVVGPDEPLAVVCRQLERERVGSALVVEDGELAGIITERDVVRAISAGAEPDKTEASAYMSRIVTTIAAHESMEEAARLMTSQRIRHLPVVDEGRLVGVLSIRDIVQWTVREVPSPDVGRHLSQLVDLV
jgi:CBS domain-containing protein